MFDDRLDLSLQTIPPIFTRKKHVLILLRDPQTKKFLLSRKKYYPPGIARMFGGGREEGELPLVAAVRETKEETQVALPPTAFKFLGRVTAKIGYIEASTIKATPPYTFVSDIFAAEIPKNNIIPSDDVDEVIEFTEAEYQQLVIRFSKLSQEIDSFKGFAWYDYGQYYGPVHTLAMQWYHQRVVQ